MNKNKRQDTYVPFDGFLLRSPLFSISKIGLVKPDDALFQEALYLASPELYNEYTNHSYKKLDKAIYKYWGRMCSRCTPFGLFASCSYGNLHDKHSKITLSETLIRHSRLDFYIISSIIEQLNKLNEVRSILKYYPNDSIYYIGDSIRYIDHSYADNRSIHKLQTIKANNYLDTLLNNSKEGKTIIELAESITDNEVSFIESKEYVEELIDNQVLKSELEPKMTVPDPLSVLIEWLERHKINSTKDIYFILKNVKITLDDIDTSFKHCPQKYEQLTSNLQRLNLDFDRKHLIHTDVYRSIKAGGISNDIINKLQDCIDFLLKASSCRAFNKELDIFIKEFSSKYELRPIPLLYALDNDLGIGYPIEENQYTKSDYIDGINRVILDNRPSISFSILEILVLRKLFSLSKDGKMASIVELKDQDIEPYFKKNTNINPPDTLSCLCQVIPHENENSIYLKSINPGAARLIGRFCYLNQNIRNLFTDICSTEQRMADDDTLLAEIIHLPDPKVAYLINRPLAREISIHYLSHSETHKDHIPASDLMLQIRNGELILFSKSLNKKICPRLSNAHNYNLNTTPLYKFLCSYQYYYYNDLAPLNFNNLLQTLGFAPRVQYKSCILHLKTWRVSKNDIGQIQDIKTNRSNCLDGWICRNNIPNEILIADGDNELYINLSNDDSRSVFLDYLGKRSSITIKEFIFGHNKYTVTDGYESYNSEFIVPFFKNQLTS